MKNLPKGKKCFCGHYMKDHGEYVGGTNSKGCKYVCHKDNCRDWNRCDLGSKNRKDTEG